MKTEFNEKPRQFKLLDGQIVISDVGKIHLDADEMVSFVTPDGKECDFTAKEWGFYPTSSVNSRMVREGFKVCLVADGNGKVQINVVDKEKVEQFRDYLNLHGGDLRIILWLDELNSDKLDMLGKLFTNGNHERT